LLPGEADKNSTLDAAIIAKLTTNSCKAPATRELMVRYWVWWDVLGIDVVGEVFFEFGLKMDSLNALQCIYLVHTLLWFVPQNLIMV
jgi:hypothetical protein